MPNWDILCLSALETWYKCKILQLPVFSENIAMGRSISKIFWNGVNWDYWARTICDDSFAVLSSHSFWRFWNFFWLISMFWRNSHSKIQKSGAIDFHFTPLFSSPYEILKKFSTRWNCPPRFNHMLVNVCVNTCT